MKKECPRCGNDTHCRADDIQRCHCNEVYLSPPARAYIGENYSGCLCAACLKAISKAFTPPAAGPSINHKQEP